jgi:hypothetical protein
MGDPFHCERLQLRDGLILRAELSSPWPQARLTAVEPSVQSELAFGIGLKHEATLTDTERKRGAHYTAPRLAHALCELTLDRWSGSGVPLICDPSCGGGAFLIGAAEALVRRGVSPTTILNGGLIGIDVDPKAIDTTRAAQHITFALTLWWLTPWWNAPTSLAGLMLLLVIRRFKANFLSGPPVLKPHEWGSLHVSVRPQLGMWTQLRSLSY